MTEFALKQLQDSSQPPKVRMDALLVLVQTFEPAYLDVLQTILGDPNEHADVRSAAALALGKVGGESALPLLIEHAESADVTVRNYALQALGMLQDPRAVPPLIEALKDPNNHVFNSAAEALGQTGPAAVPHLIELLNTGAEDARCVAAWKLGEMGCADALEHLVDVVKSSHNPDLTALAIWALGEIGVAQEAALDALSDAKQHQNPDISERATMALKKIARHHN